MKIAVLSDIHSNYPAFNAVVQQIKGVDQFWFLGDLFGYGPYPIETYRRFESLQNVCSVRGNHDDRLISQLCTLNQIASSAIIKNMEALNAYPGYQNELLPFIQKLPSVFSPIPSFYFSHGAADFANSNYLNTITQYPETNSDIQRMVNSYNANFEKFSNYPWVKNPTGSYLKPYVILVGHKHEQFAKVYNYLTQSINEIPISYFQGSDSAIIQYHLDSNSCLILNPGSVGLPRDGQNSYRNGNRWANYMILTVNDESPISIEFHRIQYSVQELINQLDVCGYPQEIIQWYK